MSSNLYMQPQNLDILCGMENEKGEGFWCKKTKKPYYSEMGKLVFELYANHKNSDIIEEFFEMIEKKLFNEMSIKTTDGDNEELLIYFQVSPQSWELEEVKKVLKNAWSYLTAFEDYQYE